LLKESRKRRFFAHETMDKAATSHNTDLDETHEDLLNHLFLQ
jgi:hypothetical protein